MPPHFSPPDSTTLSLNSYVASVLNGRLASLSMANDWTLAPLVRVNFVDNNGKKGTATLKMFRKFPNAPLYDYVKGDFIKDEQGNTLTNLGFLGRWDAWEGEYLIGAAYDTGVWLLQLDCPLPTPEEKLLGSRVAIAAKQAGADATEATTIGEHASVAGVEGAARAALTLGASRAQTDVIRDASVAPDLAGSTPLEPLMRSVRVLAESARDAVHAMTAFQRSPKDRDKSLEWKPEGPFSVSDFRTFVARLDSLSDLEYESRMTALRVELLSPVPPIPGKAPQSPYAAHNFYIRVHERFEAFARSMAAVREALCNGINCPAALVSLRTDYAWLRAEQARWMYGVPQEDFVNKALASTSDDPFDGIGPAMARRSIVKQQRGNRQRSDKPLCSHCGRSGHAEATCWKLHPEMKQKNGKGGNQ